MFHVVELEKESLLQEHTGFGVLGILKWLRSLKTCKDTK